MKWLLLFIVFVAASVTTTLADPFHGFNEDARYFYFAGDGDHTLHLFDSEEPPDLKLIEENTRNPGDFMYRLYTRSNPSSAQTLTFGNAASVSDSHYSFSKITVILVHGFNGDGENTMNKLLTEAFLENQDVNVIVLDWRNVASSGYITAKNGAVKVGQGLGHFLIWLVTLGTSYNNLHLVGFSLGAHVVGNAGRVTEGRVGRITGLDPAGPLWDIDNNRLGPTDARYVEIIHTDTLLLGYKNPCGTADFYPNGGFDMPGCWASTCSHNRAYEYMASSIRHNHLLANECATLRDATRDRCKGTIYPMGNSDMLKSRSGIFRVNTARNYPY